MTLGVGQILSDTFAMLRSRFWRLVGLYLVWFVILMGFTILAVAIMGGSAMALAGSMDNPGALGGIGGGMFVMIALMYLGYLLIYSAQYTSMCTMASPLRSGEFGEAMSSGLRSALPALGVMVLLLIVYLVVWGVVAAIGAAAGTSATLVLSIALLVAAIWVSARIGIVMAVVPVDGVRNPIAAITRAWNLTAGNALPIFLAFLVYILVAILAFAALLVPFMGSIGSIEQGAAPPVGSILFLALGFIVLLLVFMAGYSSLLSTIHAKLAGPADAAAAFE